MSDVKPPDNSEGPHYTPQYQVSPQFKKFWHHLFHGADISDKQLSQMTDQFIKRVWDQMSQVLNWALKQQKERDRKEKENG